MMSYNHVSGVNIGFVRGVFNEGIKKGKVIIPNFNFKGGIDNDIPLYLPFLTVIVTILGRN